MDEFQDYPSLTNQHWIIAALCEIAYNMVGPEALQIALELSSHGELVNGIQLDAAIQAASWLQDVVAEHYGR